MGIAARLERTDWRVPAREELRFSRGLASARESSPPASTADAPPPCGSACGHTGDQVLAIAVALPVSRCGGGGSQAPCGGKVPNGATPVRSDRRFGCKIPRASGACWEEVVTAGIFYRFS